MRNKIMKIKNVLAPCSVRIKSSMLCHNVFYLFAEKNKTTSINKKILTVIVNGCRYALFLFAFCLTIFYNYNKTMGKRKSIGFLKKLNSLVF